MKVRLLVIILILTFFPISSSYSEINRFYAYIIRNHEICKVVNCELYPYINLKLTNKKRIIDRCTTDVSLIGIYAEIDGEMMWKDKKVKIGKPEGKGKYNYYIYFEIIDSFGNNICKDPEKAVIKCEIKESTLLIFLKKSFISKLKEGEYRLKTIFYEIKENGKYRSINSCDCKFVYLKSNNPLMRGLKASFFAWAGWTMIIKYQWEKRRSKYSKEFTEKLFIKAVELNTNFKFVYDELIKLLIEDKKYKEIIKVLDKWISVRDTAINLITEKPFRKYVLPISKEKLREILKQVYGDKAELELKKYYPDDNKKD